MYGRILFGVQVDALWLCGWCGRLRNSVTREDMKMATYGVTPTPGWVPFTGYTPTLGVGPANVDATSGRVQFNGITQGDFAINQPLGLGGQVAAMNRILMTLLASPGGLANQIKKQVRWEVGSPGGAVPIEIITLINRVVTNADITAFQALFSRTNAPQTYAPDLSGNGGGGKQQVAGGAY
jgi:hypothetical protein